MKKGERGKRLSPTTIIFVDLMASTFAVLFLVWMVSLLRGAEESTEMALAKPQPQTESNFRITSWVIRKREGDPHPQAKPPPEELGEVRIFDNYIKFGIGNKMIKEYPDQFQAKDSLFRKFLKELADRKPKKNVHLRIYGNGMFYAVHELVTKYLGNEFIAISFVISKDEEVKEPEESISGINDKKVDELSRGGQMVEGVDPKTKEEWKLSYYKTKAAEYLRRYLEYKEYLPIWEWLTEKIYREKGFDIQYQIHEYQLTFYSDDIKELLYEIAIKPGLTGSIPLYIIIVIMLIYIYKEINLPGRRNRL
jgi:hypothetical protein